MAARKRKPRQNLRSEKHLRAWVFERVADGDHDAKTAIENMQAYVDWIRDGKRAGPPKLEIVKTA